MPDVQWKMTEFDPPPDDWDRPGGARTLKLKDRHGRVTYGSRSHMHMGYVEAGPVPRQVRAVYWAPVDDTDPVDENGKPR